MNNDPQQSKGARRHFISGYEKLIFAREATVRCLACQCHTILRALRPHLSTASVQTLDAARYLLKEDIAPRLERVHRIVKLDLGWEQPAAD